MEEIISRFPHIAENIFEELDNYYFIQCKVISPSWKNFMEESKFSYLRLIKTSTNCSKKAMKRISKKANLEDSIQLASDVSKLYDELQMAKFYGKGYIVIDYSLTLFHLSAKYGSVSVCQLMMDSIEDKHPNCGKSFRGQTPLHFAAENGHISICRLILEKVDDQIQPRVNNPKDFIDNNPLHLAAENGHLSVCKLLISWVENTYPEARNKEHEYTNAKNNCGYTPLHNAAENGYLFVCQFLVGKVGNENIKEASGLTPLGCAARKGHSAICHFLIENSFDVNIRDVYGQTALHFAAEKNLLSVCQKLLEICIEHNPEDEDGNTPFHLAARSGHQKICKLFIESGYLSKDSILGVGYLVTWGDSTLHSSKSKILQDGQSKKIKRA